MGNYGIASGGVMERKLLINCIYRATEGEGIYVGRPQVFVRFQGCKVGCLNCDSKETWSFSQKFAIPLDQVLERIDRQAMAKIKWVSLTGGDPLDPRHSSGPAELIKELKSRGYLINLEASGTRIVDQVFQQVDFISFDYKPPSTGVKFPLSHLSTLCEQYPGKFQIKSIVEDARDFYACRDAYQSLQQVGLGKGFEWCLTPAYNTHESFSADRFIQVMSLNYQSGYPFRVIGQQHKWVYGAVKREV